MYKNGDKVRVIAGSGKTHWFRNGDIVTIDDDTMNGERYWALGIGASGKEMHQALYPHEIEPYQQLKRISIDDLFLEKLRKNE